MAISRSDVYGVIAKFWQEGIQPTSVQIRERLGNKGSYTTICNFMRQWEATFLPEIANQFSPVIEGLNDLAGELHAKCGGLLMDNQKLKSEIKILKCHLDKAGLLNEIENPSRLGF